jgi:uncharacterized protein (TIGR02246 family)
MPTPDHTDHTDIAAVSAVTAVIQTWVDAFNAHDAARVSALYDAQAVLWGTLSADIITSADAINAYFDRTFQFNPPPTVRLGQLLVRVFGDAAVASGGYTLAFEIAGQSHLMPARFSFTFHREAGQWCIVDHHSSLVPAALPAPLASR